MSDAVMVPRGREWYCGMETNGERAGQMGLWLRYDNADDCKAAMQAMFAHEGYAAPPPPSVSIGSRPQEAVPTAQTVPAVVGWQDSETAPRDGRWLLLEGEMSGGDTSTVRVGRWNPTYSDATRCTYEWQCVDPYAHGTEDEAIGPDSFWNWYADGRVSGWQPLPQPADGCSSNEGAGGWIEWGGGPNPVPGRLVDADLGVGTFRNCLSDLMTMFWADAGRYRILPQTEKGS